MLHQVALHGADDLALKAEPKTLKSDDRGGYAFARGHQHNARRPGAHQPRNATDGAGAGEVVEDFRGWLAYTLTLRQGLKFSDGHPVDMEDVLFTFAFTWMKRFTLRSAIC